MFSEIISNNIIHFVFHSMNIFNKATSLIYFSSNICIFLNLALVNACN